MGGPSYLGTKCNQLLAKKSHHGSCLIWSNSSLSHLGPEDYTAEKKTLKKKHTRQIGAFRKGTVEDGVSVILDNSTDKGIRQKMGNMYCVT